MEQVLKSIEISKYMDKSTQTLTMKMMIIITSVVFEKEIHKKSST